MKQNLENGISDYKWRLYNYPVNQMFGTHTGVASLLINQHRINSVKDAEDYVARLHNTVPYFEQLIDGLKARAAAGNSSMGTKHLIDWVIIQTPFVVTNSIF